MVSEGSAEGKNGKDKGKGYRMAGDKGHQERQENGYEIGEGNLYGTRQETRQRESDTIS